jgi:DNA mismatch repair ATPase MutS
MSATRASNPYDKIQAMHMTSLAWEDEEWPHEPFGDYLKRCLDYQKNLQHIKKRRTTFKLFNSLCPDQMIYHDCLEDMGTLQDLQLFAGKREGETYLAEIIDRTKTEFGKVFLYGLLATPTHEINILKNRQQIIKTLLDNKNFLEELNEIHERFAVSENFLLSLWMQDGLLNAAQRHYFSVPYMPSINKKLNYS